MYSSLFFYFLKKPINNLKYIDINTLLKHGKKYRIMILTLNDHSNMQLRGTKS